MITGNAYAALPKRACWFLIWLVNQHNDVCWSLWRSGRQRREGYRSGKCLVSYLGEVQVEPETESVFDEADNPDDGLQAEQAVLVTAEQAQEIMLIARHMRDRDQWNTAAESYATRVLGVRLPHVNIPEGT